MSRRVRYLDELGSRGMHIDFYDPEAERHPLPAYPYHRAQRLTDPQAAARQRAAARRAEASSPDLVESTATPPAAPSGVWHSSTTPARQTRPPSNTGCPHPDRKQAE